MALAIKTVSWEVVDGIGAVCGQNVDFIDARGVAAP
jgi:hypothetical protein